MILSSFTLCLLGHSYDICLHYTSLIHFPVHTPITVESSTLRLVNRIPYCLQAEIWLPSRNPFTNTMLQQYSTLLVQRSTFLTVNKFIVNSKKISQLERHNTTDNRVGNVLYSIGYWSYSIYSIYLVFLPKYLVYYVTLIEINIS